MDYNEIFGVNRKPERGPKRLQKVTLPGYKEALGLPDETLEMRFPFIAQLNQMPMDLEGVEVILPNDMQAIGALLGECLQQLNWMKGAAYAAVLNKEAINSAVSVSQLGQTRAENETVAIIVGNGYTAVDFFSGKNWDGFGIVSCWHALPKLVEQGVDPTHVVHLDWHVPDDLPDHLHYPHCHYIASCSAAPEFWENALTHGKNTFVYYDPCDPMDRFYASLNKANEQPGCRSTVIEMCIHSAVLAGYTSIVLIGVDLLEHPTQVPDESPYAHFRQDLEAIPPMYPGVKFYNAGLEGLCIKGYEKVLRPQLNKGRIGEYTLKKKGGLWIPPGFKMKGERSASD